MLKVPGIEQKVPQSICLYYSVIMLTRKSNLLIVMNMKSMFVGMSSLSHFISRFLMLLVMSHGVLMDHFLLILHKRPETSKSDISSFFVWFFE